MREKKENLELDADCANCGKPAVSGSTFCVDCLVEVRNILEKEVSIKMTILEVQKKRITRLEALLKGSIYYGFKQNQEKVKLHRYVGELEREIAKGVESGRIG
jgi:hypothetical protein